MGLGSFSEGRSRERRSGGKGGEGEVCEWREGVESCWSGGGTAGGGEADVDGFFDVEG